MRAQATGSLTDLTHGDTLPGTSTTPAAVAGYPSVTVPAGEHGGLPVGISFYGTAWTEARLLAFAADFEAVAQARREPKFLTTLGVK